MDMEDNVFLLAGPVKMHPRVINAMARPAFPHRSAEFRAINHEIRELLYYLFQVDPDTWDVTPLSGSGTAALDAVASNFFKPGDKVLSITNGKFGERLYEMANMYTKGNAIELRCSEWGQPPDLEKLDEILSSDDFRAVTLCHNETASGITNPAKEVGAIAKKHNALFILDGITSVGGIRVVPDELGADVVIVGSQKCIGAPSGMSAVAVRKEVEDMMYSNHSYYLDLKKHIDKINKDDTPYTPAIPLFFAFLEALRIIKEEGIETRWKRNESMAIATRAAVKALGLKLFPHEDFLSNTLTAIWYPEGITDKEFRGTLQDRYHVIVAGAQEHIKGKVFRIGHMGTIKWTDLAAGIAAIEATFMSLGYRDFNPGDGTACIVKAMEKEGKLNR